MRYNWWPMQVSECYAALRESPRVRERALFQALRTPSELELQARWFAGEFGKNFVSTSGEKIEVIQFGTWNREAGPDFRDASIRINGTEAVRGSIEIDLMDRSWESHEHATNPAFEETVLHVFVEQSERKFFTRTRSNRNVLQVRIDPAILPEAFNANIPLARPGRCHAPLKDLPEEKLCRVLAGAAQFRLRRKAALLRTKIDSHGHDEALFQEIATAFGYKENKLPFTVLAQRLPLSFLRQHSADIEAMLFGTAGFLGSADLAAYQAPARSYLRDLWDRWWPYRDSMRRIIVPKTSWRITGTRPVNHPQRRLAALAIVGGDWPAFSRAINKRTKNAVEEYFARIDHPFWKFHYTLTSDATPKEMALIGASRSAEILANVLYPFWLSQNADVWAEYSVLPARLSNRRLETGATRLFGDDPRRGRFLRTIANQQAVLQIYEDFCLQDNSDCAECPFPEQLRRWS
ncbi:MAG: hypothetical protein QOG67_104 [Verrucomicrobiota bacterium]